MKIIPNTYDGVNSEVALKFRQEWNFETFYNLFIPKISLPALFKPHLSNKYQLVDKNYIRHVSKF